MFNVKINKLKILLSGWLFLISLSSFYFYSINIALPPAFAAFIALIAVPLMLGKSVLKELLKIKLLLIFFALLIVFGLGLTLDDADVLVNRFAALPLFVGVVVCWLFFLIRHKEVLFRSLKFVIQIHLLAFYLQVISFYSGLGYIDYLFGITGEYQRAFGGSYSIDILGGAFIRPTGLYNEPGTYSTVLMLLFLLYERVGKTISSQVSSNDWLFVAATIFSVLISFSVFGMIFVVIYIVNSIRNSKSAFFIFFALLLLLLSAIYEVYLFPRFFSGGYSDNGTDFRSEIISQYLGQISENPINFIFGFGFFSDLAVRFDGYVLNDVGLFFSVLLQSGFLGLCIFLICLFGGLGLSRHNLPLVLIFGLCKISITTMFFWVVLLSIVIFNFSGFYKTKEGY